MSIHPTAVIAAGAEIGREVVVEPYAIVGARVRIGDRSRIGAHAVLDGRTTIGRNNRIFHHASVGAPPQDLKYRGEDSELVIGDDNTIREFTTLHLGTAGGGMVTRVGSRNLIMAYAHVAHDCQVGDANVLANGAQLGGHVRIESHVRVSALVGIHQFVRVGEAAILGAGSMVSQDVPPYCNVTGDRARLRGLNLEGLKRLGFGAQLIGDLKQAYRLMFRSKLTVQAAVERIRSEVRPSPEIDKFLDLIVSSQRGVCR